MLLIKCAGDNHSDIKENLLSREVLHFNNNKIELTDRWDDTLSAILLESDNTVPSIERCENLARQLREIFPKGMKVGSSAWRGNVREIGLRLQKFFKLYGNWDDEDIIEAAKTYVDYFSADRTKMRILKYFILKLDKDTNELISDLATFLENDVEDLDKSWLMNIR